MNQRTSDIEEQAAGYLAVFWNENGNCSICQVIFANITQAKEWASKALERDGFTVKASTNSGVTALGTGGEQGYRFIPVILAEDDTAASEVSFDHMKIIR